MPTYRSVRGRALARGAVGSAAYSGALTKRTRSGSRIGMPTSRRNRTFRYGGASYSSRYSSGVAGSARRYVAGVGREVPLFLPNRRSLTEAHYKTTASATYPFNVTGDIELLNNVQAGSLLVNRTGSRIMMSQLQIRGVVKSNINTTVASCALYIVYDRQPQGALPAITDILDSVSSNSFQRLENRDRFSILLRRRWSFEGSTAAPTSDTIRTVDSVLYLNRPTTFTAGAGSDIIQDIRSGALYAVFVGDAPANSTALQGDLAFRLVFAP